MPVGVIAAGVGAAGAVAGAVISGNASSNAAKTVQQGANTATAEQQREYNQSRADLQPWLSTGQAALAQLSSMYGLTPSGATAAPNSTPGTTTSGQFIDVNGKQVQIPAADVAATGVPTTSGTTPNPNGTSDPFASFYQSPDYAFTLGRGINGVDAGAAANGTLDSGATRKAEISYAGNLADSQYNSYANRLAALAGVGQSAANTDASTGQNTATNISNIAQNAANNQASSYLAQGAGYSGAISQLAGIGSGLITNLRQPQPSSGFTLNGNF